MLIGLDIGTQKTGIARSVNGLAQAVQKIPTSQLIGFLTQLMAEQTVEQIVIGLPVANNGEPTSQAEYCQIQGEAIRQATGLPVSYEDEYLTTVEAERLLKEAGFKEPDIKERLDQVSAELILQQYLNRDRG